MSSSEPICYKCRKQKAVHKKLCLDCAIIQHKLEQKLEQEKVKQQKQELDQLEKELVNLSETYPKIVDLIKMMNDKINGLEAETRNLRGQVAKSNNHARFCPFVPK